MIGGIRDRLRQLVRLLGVIGVKFHRGGDLFHAGGRLLQRRGGGFRALGQIAVSRRQFAAAGINLRAGVTHPQNRVHQRLAHPFDGRVQAIKFLARWRVQGVG